MEIVARTTQLRAEGCRLAELATIGGLDRPVAACSGWTVTELLQHVGEVHRWATVAIETAVQPDEAVVESLMPGYEDDPSSWLIAGINALVNALESRDQTAPTWHPFPAPMTVGFWARRQLHETTVHRWDAEYALDALTPIETATAVDGIDEFLRVILPRRLKADGAVQPTAALHLHCTDVDPEADADWLVRHSGGELEVGRSSGPAEVALIGSAESLLLALWGRTGAAADDHEAIGEPDRLAEWTSTG